MEIVSSHKGQTVKTAVVRGATSHEEAAFFVMRFFRETPSRLTDWDTDEYDRGLITVRLYTD